MKEYSVTVTSPITRTYIIEAESSNEAILNALEFFNEGEEGIDNEEVNLDNIGIEIIFKNMEE